METKADEELQPTRSCSRGDSLMLAMAYDGTGRRVSKTRYRKVCVSDKADGVYDADWERELVTHYTGIGTEVRENYRDGSLQNARVVVNMPQGLGRYMPEDASAPVVPSTTLDENGKPTDWSVFNPKFEWYLKNHLGSTMLVYGTQSTSNADVADLGEVKKAYDYRSFGEQVDLAVPAEKVTENFTGKEKDDETDLNYFGARYLDPMIGMWTSVDPARQFASPYLYVGNGYNPVNVIDPDGNETYVTVDENGLIANMTFCANEDNHVYFNFADGSSFTTLEPDVDSYFYSTDKDGFYNILFTTLDLGMEKNAKEMMNNVSIFRPMQWGSGGDYDFKYQYYKTKDKSVYTVGVLNGVAMTARDAGNALWGGYVTFLPYNLMIRASDWAAGGSEDYQSSSMQLWGYENAFGKNYH